ncbi:nitrous oxide reductase accessory protein NosL [Marinobacter koreensis]|uniref:Nitrous oxide reductase accessory protein NosL n=1 Tax=Marinobacter koreensis TaxID=335974 RepID=A0ABW0RJA5_9GAMM|nr:nitrous oxide reductase accessory protein NosL [Marinobacter koreensis]MCK7546571.1 nitrous oxide reductase accessory protein NosL [Marinobacter koreensis]
MRLNIPRFHWFLIILSAFTISACSGGEETVAEKPAPVHIESGDECHVCGMIISGFPGPKGESIAGDSQRVRKFCSTRELFAWKLQPENIHQNDTLYVHDMAQTDWDNPADTALVDARDAFYVAGSDAKGAMGPTLASFALEAEARKFANSHGGRVLRYGEITLADVSGGMAMGEMGDMDH